MQWLLFTLYAPMGSLGEIAVGERRMGWTRPSRSAVLGLVAAAQGTHRTDENAHRELDEALHFAVRTDSIGSPFVDYHTTQTPKKQAGQAFRTRREELGATNLHTVLSFREWRSDSSYTVALWPKKNSTANLDSIAQALNHPRFTLYLGRKAAPLGLPMNPEVIEAADLMTAFSARHHNAAERSVVDCIRSDPSVQAEVAFDLAAPGTPKEMRVERRRDSLKSRSNWQFSDRMEGIVMAEGDPE